VRRKKTPTDAPSRAGPTFSTARSLLCTRGLIAASNTPALREGKARAKKFAGLQVRRGETTGMPLIQGAAATFECMKVNQIDGGDHTVFVGRLVASTSFPNEPLVYFNRQFGGFKGA
jgi:flavin reductase (DIM6/NTAB) family NADH-FMN oxidoreductase RutF